MARRCCFHGRATLPIEQFIALLHTYGIRCLADIRTVPRSRHNPQFNGLADLFSKILSGKHARAQTYTRIINDTHELANHSTFNIAYVRDQLNEFNRLQDVKIRVMKAAGLAQSGKTDEAEEALQTSIPSKNSRALTSRSLDQFEARDIDWLWYPFVPLGELTSFIGAGATGKSTITVDMAVGIAKGGAWPAFEDEKPETAPQGSTLFVTRENDPSTVIRPRLEAAGADVATLKHVHVIGREDSELTL